MTKILVTGGAGYIGSVVVDLLLNNGMGEVFIVDNLSTGHKELINKKAKFFEADLIDPENLKRIFKKVKPEIVMHFAGLSQVGESNKMPEKYHMNNVFGGECLLKAMLESGCKKIVFSSSAAVYGEPLEIPITEKHVLRPISVYGETKVLFEEMLRTYDKDFGIKSLCLRYFNAGGASENGLFGEMHEPESHLIPNILKAAKKGGEFKLFGDDYETKDGTCIRDYIHVEDLARAHIFGAKYLLKGGKYETVNLGTGEGFSVKEIVDVCRKVTGKKFEVLIESRRVGDPAVLVAGNEKAGKLLLWKPEKSIKEIVESAWRYEENRCND